MDRGCVVTDSPAICPHCGYDLIPSAPIDRDGLSIDPTGRVVLNGRPLPVTRQEREGLYALVKANGQTVSRHVLAERLGIADVVTHIDVMMHRIRRKLGDEAYRIETVWGRGWRWVAA